MYIMWAEWEGKSHEVIPVITDCVPEVDKALADSILSHAQWRFYDLWLLIFKIIQSINTINCYCTNQWSPIYLCSAIPITFRTVRTTNWWLYHFLIIGLFKIVRACLTTILGTERLVRILSMGHEERYFTPKLYVITSAAGLFTILPIMFDSFLTGHASRHLWYKSLAQIFPLAKSQSAANSKGRQIPIRKPIWREKSY